MSDEEYVEFEWTNERHERVLDLTIELCKSAQELAKLLPDDRQLTLHLKIILDLLVALGAPGEGAAPIYAQIEEALRS